MKFTIHGARGSLPTCSSAFERYGGNSTCFSLSTGKGIIVIDAGSGIQSLSDALARSSRQRPIAILFTHFHLDHVVGLPSFEPFYDHAANVKIMGYSRETRWRAALKKIFSAPYWPVSLARADAQVSLEDLPEKGKMTLFGVGVSWLPLHHPQPCLAYRFEARGRAVVVATDHEHGNASIDAALQNFVRGADVLIYDAQYTPEEYPKRIGWGHSTWLAGTELAAAAGVGRLILTHHDRHRTDTQIEELTRRSRAVFAKTDAARENMKLDI